MYSLTDQLTWYVINDIGNTIIKVVVARVYSIYYRIILHHDTLHIRQN